MMRAREGEPSPPTPTLSLPHLYLEVLCPSPPGAALALPLRA